MGIISWCYFVLIYQIIFTASLISLSNLPHCSNENANQTMQIWTMYIILQFSSCPDQALPFIPYFSLHHKWQGCTFLGCPFHGLLWRFSAPSADFLAVVLTSGPRAQSALWTMSSSSQRLPQGQKSGSGWGSDGSLYCHCFWQLRLQLLPCHPWDAGQAG